VAEISPFRANHSRNGACLEQWNEDLHSTRPTGRIFVTRRRLRMEQAIGSLPDLHDLLPLKEALIDASGLPGGDTWAGSRSYATVGRRIADAAAVEARIPEMAERVRARAETVLRSVVRALQQLEQGDWAAAAASLVAAGEIEEASWRLDEAEQYYRKALELGRKPRDRRGEALALKRLARLARTRGDLPEALRLYLAGYGVSEAARDAAGMVVGCLGVGNVHVDQGNWMAASEWYHRGLEALEDRSTAEFLHLCNALSVVERRLNRFAESDAWLAAGEAEAPHVDDAGARRYLEHGRARLHVARGELAEAERVLREMLNREVEPVARISAMINLAEPLLLQGAYGEAESLLRGAESLALRYHATPHLAYVYEQMGKLAGARRDPEGFLFFEQALDLVRQHRLPKAQYAATQHAYGIFEADTGSMESGIARLEVARKCFRSIGAEVDADAVERDIEGLRARSGNEENFAPKDEGAESDTI
jgi:tetratricopeptide (TPR) repeat protein